jgi:hypothetical protein
MIFVLFSKLVYTLNLVEFLLNKRRRFEQELNKNSRIRISNFEYLLACNKWLQSNQVSPDQAQWASQRNGQSLHIEDALRKIVASEGLEKEELRKLIEAAELNEKRLRENEDKMAKLQTKLQRLERNGVSSVNCPQRPKDMMGQHRSMGCLELTSSLVCYIDVANINSTRLIYYDNKGCSKKNDRFLFLFISFLFLSGFS